MTRETETYDRVITDFSPDGRLSQVEYGMEASRRGSTIAAATTNAGICLIIHNSSFGKIHRLDHHIWLVTTGLSGDARVFANQLRTNCQKHRLDYGEAPTTEQVAHMAGQFQHYLTRAGGIRPLGCTALVLGIDPVYDDYDGEGDGDETTKLVGVPKVFQTDPGGIVEACTLGQCCAAGKGCDAVAKEIGSFLAGNHFSSPSEEEKGKVLARMASQMAKSVLGKLDDPNKTVDIWTFEPRQGKRGGIQATCYQQVDKESLSNKAMIQS